MTITKEQLDNILKKHTLWVENESGGERANLRGANLYGADLSGANLRGANLDGADLSGADLSEADLSGADLYQANLYQADLRGASLYQADLSEADLSEADLYQANLYQADLSEANLRGADLHQADLRGANLYQANLYQADLYQADLYGAKNLNLPMACPEEGSFIGFKKCRNDFIVKLEIPSDSLRCSATGRKCRCSKAKVISITNLDGTNANTNVTTSKKDPNFIYKVGETVEVKNFDTNRWNECSTGIHFFITRQEAVDYVY